MDAEAVWLEALPIVGAFVQVVFLFAGIMFVFRLLWMIVGGR